MDLILAIVAGALLLVAACCAAVDTVDRARGRDPLALLSLVGALVCGVATVGTVEVVLTLLGTTA